MTGRRRKKAAIITASIFALMLGAAAGGVAYFLVRPGGPAGGMLYSLISCLGVATLSYRFFTRKLRRRKKILTEAFPPRWEDHLRRHVPVYSGLGPSEQEIFRRRVQIFLGEKSITGIETEVDDETRILIAASAVLPVFRLPEFEYDSLGEVLVYPGSFDDSYATEGDGQDILGMVISNSSTMIISKPALYESFRNSHDGHNVGIHEFMHKIDEEDGAIDGIPSLLMDRRSIKKWNAVMEKEVKLIEEGSSDINPYALTNSAEFFAVAAEYFFEKPEVMARRHPELYTLFSSAFQQDLKSIMKSVTADMMGGRRKKTRRNAPCPCGSGKKYKHCCLKKKQ